MHKYFHPCALLLALQTAGVNSDCSVEFGHVRASLTQILENSIEWSIVHV